ncbi:rhodanese-related sulfurtransferase [bacterium]|mgnify:CR=1 FL=1|jgi:predicted sulfurtransferase|nr:rhodanese-related sulfurtransferase [bacterium]MBT5014808.1 rhodanese-related sulfurtransferase [bacterium]
MEKATGNILLYYKYVEVESPKAIMKWQRELCEELELTGRILIAHEGINGTVGGSIESAQAYIKAMNEHPLFGGIDFKISPGSSEYFPRLRIVVKEEICALGVSPEELTVADGGVHLTPEQTHELLSNQPDDLVILDTRNNYESDIGKFDDAIIPDIKNFRDFPQYVEDNLETYKDKPVLMYCTGGVRCERATAYLKQKGIAKEVYQIEGGIQRYGEKYPDGFFRGKNYVFDSRISVKVNDDVLGSCYICEKPNDDYYNCVNALCNRHFIGCKDCIVKYNNACSSQCLTLVEKKEVKERSPFVKLP